MRQTGKQAASAAVVRMAHIGGPIIDVHNEKNVRQELERLCVARQCA